jgi:hypothetical protein
MHSCCFGIMEGHGNFAFNLVVKLSVELGYVFLSLRLYIAPMSSALLSVLPVCNRRIPRHCGNSVTCYVHLDRSACQAHFSEGNPTVCPTLKK